MVRDQIAGYVVLQRLLDRRSTLRRERDTAPEALTKLRGQFSARQGQLDAQRGRRENLAKEQAVLQQESEALQEEREHFRKQKSQVTNMKQLSAVVSELDHVESQLKAKEDRLLEILQELEALEREISTLTEETPAERAAREQAEATWADRRQAAEQELQEVDRELRVAQSHLGEVSMARFKKLWASRKPSAVVPMDGTACSSCHADLRPSLVQVVRAAEELAFCDHCRRLLYDPEQFATQ
ncbi:MAG: zinc ribbon domain-containing protein [Thermoanaerobaculales bacterium]|jgi:predicted  nucleic acid-binding Zn-ribbon protein